MTKVLILDDSGRLKYTLEGVGDFNADDITVLPRKLVKECSLSAVGFDELFFESVKTSKNYAAAYEKAEVKHFELFGKRKYVSYKIYKSAKSNRMNKK